MKVFLSWSGGYSEQIAAAFKEWLPLLINEIDPFMSSNIEAGSRWQSEISSALEMTDFGIIFVTAENQSKPWLNFEAGALAKSVANSHVVPLAIDLKLSEIQNPLGQFQAQELSKRGVDSIVRAINATAQRPLSDEILSKVLEMWWPVLHEKVEAIKSGPLAQAAIPVPKRPEREILEEVLAAVRGMDRNQRSLASSVTRLERQTGTKASKSPLVERHSQQFYSSLQHILSKDVGAAEFMSNPDGHVTVFIPRVLGKKALSEVFETASDFNVNVQLNVNPDLFEGDPRLVDGVK
ncbi:TIR domain-containing protein [Amycolatopsis speibonae]|uniref:TIR domain-containing protein n=1 Tax=Amycolatopsis speibonae TaxID=1450224 RepID=A0ABV7P941_9PSEU